MERVREGGVGGVGIVVLRVEGSTWYTLFVHFAFLCLLGASKMGPGSVYQALFLCARYHARKGGEGVKRQWEKLGSKR